MLFNDLDKMLNALKTSSVPKEGKIKHAAPVKESTELDLLKASREVIEGVVPDVTKDDPETTIKKLIEMAMKEQDNDNKDQMGGREYLGMSGDQVYYATFDRGQGEAGGTSIGADAAATAGLPGAGPSKETIKSVKIYDASDEEIKTIENDKDADNADMLYKIVQELSLDSISFRLIDSLGLLEKPQEEKKPAPETPEKEKKEPEEDIEKERAEKTPEEPASQIGMEQGSAAIKPEGVAKESVDEAKVCPSCGKKNEAGGCKSCTPERVKKAIQVGKKTADEKKKNESYASAAKPGVWDYCYSCGKELTDNMKEGTDWFQGGEGGEKYPLCKDCHYAGGQPASEAMSKAEYEKGEPGYYAPDKRNIKPVDMPAMAKTGEPKEAPAAPKGSIEVTDKSGQVKMVVPGSSKAKYATGSNTKQIGQTATILAVKDNKGSMYALLKFDNGEMWPANVKNIEVVEARKAVGKYIAEENEAMINDKVFNETFANKKSFINYLKNTLIPDLRDSGRDATADDFEEAIYWLEKVNEETMNEVAPKGWEPTVKKMKKNKKISNPWALAWYMKGKGYKPAKESYGILLQNYDDDQPQQTIQHATGEKKFVKRVLAKDWDAGDNNYNLPYVVIHKGAYHDVYEGVAEAKVSKKELAAAAERTKSAVSFLRKIHKAIEIAKLETVMDALEKAATKGDIDDKQEARLKDAWKRKKEALASNPKETEPTKEEEKEVEAADEAVATAGGEDWSKKIEQFEYAMNGFKNLSGAHVKVENVRDEGNKLIADVTLVTGEGSDEVDTELYRDVSYTKAGLEAFLSGKEPAKDDVRKDTENDVEDEGGPRESVKEAKKEKEYNDKLAELLKKRQEDKLTQVEYDEALEKLKREYEAPQEGAPVAELPKDVEKREKEEIKNEAKANANIDWNLVVEIEDEYTAHCQKMHDDINVEDLLTFMELNYRDAEQAVKNEVIKTIEKKEKELDRADAEKYRHENESRVNEFNEFNVMKALIADELEDGDNAEVLMQKYMTYTEGTSNKFHQFAIFKVGDEYVAANAYGKIGNQPQAIIFAKGDSLNTVKAAYDKKVASKTKKGYVEESIKESKINESYYELGPVPSDEECVQVNKDTDYQPKMREEVQKYVELLDKKFPRPEGVNAYFKAKSFPHEFGSYMEAVVVYNEDDPKSNQFMLHVEHNLPSKWTDTAEVPFVYEPEPEADPDDDLGEAKVNEKKCHCIVKHAITDQERESVKKMLDYFRKIGDSTGIAMAIAMLQPCETPENESANEEVNSKAVLARMKAAIDEVDPSGEYVVYYGGSGVTTKQLGKIIGIVKYKGLPADKENRLHELIKLITDEVSGAKFKTGKTSTYTALYITESKVNEDAGLTELHAIAREVKRAEDRGSLSGNMYRYIEKNYSHLRPADIRAVMGIIDDEMSESKVNEDSHDHVKANFGPGKYYIGDPCYVMKDSLYDKWGEETDWAGSGEFTVDGMKFACSHTAYGDGEYTGSDGKGYGVDAGIIGVVPEEMWDPNKHGEDLGTIVDVKSRLQFKADEGVFKFDIDGKTLTINTKDEGEDDEDEDADESKKPRKWMKKKIVPMRKKLAKPAVKEGMVDDLQGAMRGQVGNAPAGYTIKHEGNKSVITNKKTGKSVEVPLFAVKDVLAALDALKECKIKEEFGRGVYEFGDWSDAQLAKVKKAIETLNEFGLGVDEDMEVEINNEITRRADTKKYGPSESKVNEGARYNAKTFWAHIVGPYPIDALLADGLETEYVEPRQGVSEEDFKKELQQFINVVKQWQKDGWKQVSVSGAESEIFPLMGAYTPHHTKIKSEGKVEEARNAVAKVDFMLPDKDGRKVSIEKGMTVELAGPYRDHKGKESYTIRVGKFFGTFDKEKVFTLVESKVNEGKVADPTSDNMDGIMKDLLEKYGLNEQMDPGKVMAFMRAELAKDETISASALAIKARTEFDWLGEEAAGDIADEVVGEKV